MIWSFGCEDLYFKVLPYFATVLELASFSSECAKHFGAPYSATDPKALDDSTSTLRNLGFCVYLNI